MRVAILCEFSGIVRDAFIHHGHDAISCDLLDTERLGPHFKGDAREFMRTRGYFDRIIAHPECTYLTNAGVRWLYKNEQVKDSLGFRYRSKVRDLNRWEKMREGAEFFKWCLNLDAGGVCVENPIMHSYALKIIGCSASQFIQPWQFGHGEIKATGFWLRRLPLLVPTNIVDGREPRVHFASPGPNRWKERSRTLPGIADAFATQWGKS